MNVIMTAWKSGAGSEKSLGLTRHTAHRWRPTSPGSLLILSKSTLTRTIRCEFFKNKNAGCINQRSEIANRCMHKRKFLLNFVCAPDWFVMFSLFWFFKKRVRLDCFYRYFVAISFPFSCFNKLPARSYASNHLRRFLAWSSRPPLIFPVFFHFFFFLMRAAAISSCRCLVSLVSCHWTFWGSLSRETLSKSRLLKHLCVFI